jgi:cell wall-associated NlpC family hydrolase
VAPRNPCPGAQGRVAARPGSRLTLLWLLALALVLAVLPLGRPAAADVPVPSAGEVSAAQDAANRSAVQVSAIQAELDRAQGAVQALDVEAGIAVERYDGARLRQQAAQQASARAAAVAARSVAEWAAARQAAAELAAAQYRMGVPAGLAAFRDLLSARNMHEAGLQQQALHSVDEGTRAVVDRATAAAAWAGTASTAAATALAEATQATAAVKQAAAEVQARLRNQRTEAAAIDARRMVLVQQLAAAQRISVALAEQRQQALAAAAAKAAAEAARQAALAAAARQSAAAASSAPTHSVSAPTHSVSAPTHSASAAADPAAAVAYARAQLGRPYVWGAAGPDAFDCSGLTMRAWEQGGVELPHFAADQYAGSTPLSYSQLSPGDLVFWSHDGTAQDIYHVAIYIGDDQMIEAPHTGAVVKVASLWIMGTPNFYARP